MAIETPTSELEAVNALLKLVEEEPVNSLVGNADDPDVEAARLTISSTSRLFQAPGWDFNTEEMELSPSALGIISVPANASKVAVSGERVSIRAGKLYSLTRRSNRFDNAVTAEVITMLSFEDLPELVRQIVVLQAGIAFMYRAPDAEIERMLARQLAPALVTFEQENTIAEGLSMTNSDAIAQIGR